MITISTSTCVRTLANRRALGAAQAELADPLRHALPDHAGQAERRPSAAGSRRWCRRRRAASCTARSLSSRIGVERLRPRTTSRRRRAISALDQRLLERRRSCRVAGARRCARGSAGLRVAVRRAACDGTGSSPGVESSPCWRNSSIDADDALDLRLLVRVAAADRWDRAPPG